MAWRDIIGREFGPGYFSGRENASPASQIEGIDPNLQELVEDKIISSLEIKNKPASKKKKDEVRPAIMAAASGIMKARLASAEELANGKELTDEKIEISRQSKILGIAQNLYRKLSSSGFKDEQVNNISFAVDDLSTQYAAGLKEEKSTEKIDSKVLLASHADKVEEVTQAAIEELKKLKLENEQPLPEKDLQNIIETVRPLVEARLLSIHANSDEERNALGAVADKKSVALEDAVLKAGIGEAATYVMVSRVDTGITDKLIDGVVR